MQPQKKRAKEGEGGEGVVSGEAADLLAAALDHEQRRARAKTRKHFKLTVCERCFRSHVSDYMVLGCVRDGSCELYGAPFHLGFELLFAETDKPKASKLLRHHVMPSGELHELRGGRWVPIRTLKKLERDTRVSIGEAEDGS